MKVLAAFLVVLMLTGCGSKDEELSRAMALRAKLLTSSVSFNAEITADYGDEVHTFSVYCEGDSQGNLGFKVTAPDTIADITGRIEAGEGKLTFRDTVLAFPLLAEDQLSPVSAPWVFYTTLRGGYLTAAGMEEDLLRLTIDDSYADNALTVDIWLEEGKVEEAEIAWEGRRCVTMTVEDFSA